METDVAQEPIEVPTSGIAWTVRDGVRTVVFSTRDDGVVGTLKLGNAPIFKGNIEASARVFSECMAPIHWPDTP